MQTPGSPAQVSTSSARSGAVVGMPRARAKGVRGERQAGTDPQPGEAMLLLHEGRADDAWSALTAALHGRDRVGRARLLREGVEIALTLGRLQLLT